MKRKQAIREGFRTSVFKRDNNRCRVCNVTNVNLDAHHITDRNEMPNGGYVLSNGISLCHDCHEKAEVFHSSSGRDWFPSMHPNDLYALVGSSKEKAFLDSKKL